MLTPTQEALVKSTVNDALNRAEYHWKNGGHKLAANRAIVEDALSKSFEDHEPSKIPGHELVQDSETVIDEFIAFVADMRQSSNHLMCAISEKKADVSGLQRVYYETSALLPALGLAVKFEEGSVTEYLGDGLLALFKVDSSDKSEAIYAAHRAAKNSINDIRSIVNETLHERYRLPGVDLGVGLSLSQTLVTLVGLPGEKHPKAFGECVFRATKLSGGINEIISDENLKAAWPSKKGGTLAFKAKQVKGENGYVLARSE